jgi:hypothetical protein
MTPHEILADIHALEEELLSFERKYGVRSETFYSAYVSGEEPENEEWVLDFGEWSSVYRTWLARQAEYRNEIQRVQQNSSSLTGLVRVSA